MYLPHPVTALTAKRTESSKIIFTLAIYTLGGGHTHTHTHTNTHTSKHTHKHTHTSTHTHTHTHIRWQSV